MCCSQCLSGVERQHLLIRSERTTLSDFDLTNGIMLFFIEFLTLVRVVHTACTSRIRIPSGRRDDNGKQVKMLEHRD